MFYYKFFLSEIISYVRINTTVFNDNQSALKLLEVKEYSHKRTKHMDLRYHFVKDLVQKDYISIKYLSTNDMIADVLTKPLSSTKHSSFIKDLNVKER